MEAAWGVAERFETDPEPGIGHVEVRPFPADEADDRAGHGIDPDPHFRRRPSMIIIVAATDEVRRTRADREFHTLERTAQ